MLIYKQNRIVLYVQWYFARSLNKRYTNTLKEVSGLYPSNNQSTLLWIIK